MLSESILNGTSDCFAMARIPQSDQPYWMSTLDSLYSAKKKERHDLNREHNSRRGFVSQALIKAVKHQKNLCENINKVTLKPREALGMVLAYYCRPFVATAVY